MIVWYATAANLVPTIALALVISIAAALDHQPNISRDTFIYAGVTVVMIVLHRAVVFIRHRRRGC